MSDYSPTSACDKNNESVLVCLHVFVTACTYIFVLIMNNLIHVHHVMFVVAFRTSGTNNIQSHISENCDNWIITM